MVPLSSQHWCCKIRNTLTFWFSSYFLMWGRYGLMLSFFSRKERSRNLFVQTGSLTLCCCSCSVCFPPTWQGWCWVVNSAESMFGLETAHCLLTYVASPKCDSGEGRMNCEQTAWRCPVWASDWQFVWVFLGVALECWVITLPVQSLCSGNVNGAVEFPSYLLTYFLSCFWS